MVYAIIAYMIIMMSTSPYTIINTNLETGMLYLLFLFMIALFIVINEERHFCDECYPDARRENIIELLKSDEYLGKLPIGVDYEETCQRNPRITDRWINHQLLPNLPAIKQADKTGDRRRMNRLLESIGSEYAFYELRRKNGIGSLRKECFDMDADDATYRYTSEHVE